MISSRCNDRIRTADGGSMTLSEFRVEAKKAIEEFEIFGQPSFECWVHEDEPAMPAGVDFWEYCRTIVRARDIVLILFNGNAGHAKNESDVGLCHAELLAAREIGGARVRIIDVQEANVGKLSGSRARNQRFQDYIKDQDVGVRFAANSGEARERLLEALQDALVSMVREGSASSRRSRYDTGAPLDWSRMDFVGRKAAMEKVLGAALKENGAKLTGPGHVHQIDGAPIFVCCHAVPAAMTVAAAREMVGRPFLHDHKLAAYLSATVLGPVHLIACQRGVTESQASALLGFPDATLVTPSFGVYVADNIQKIQLVLLANCRDESSTRYAAQRFFDWLRQTGEARYFKSRAAGRKTIVLAIADQTGTT
jgi:hypothetical protein